ncbi:hypothetical protein OV203_02550 [Nannocystis sp. ILAH1]|uniref:hypothetical protein n=1 Tax=Nannocystis sp. ILAH1 TaxID=2996789 RepID=UPI00226F5B8A|nr:hypothetical protein [Nannocystis sp. ILAH1]MCY0985992.1 hypothetical protein [Nannocystis sp. ILAH1]
MTCADDERRALGLLRLAGGRVARCQPRQRAAWAGDLVTAADLSLRAYGDRRPVRDLATAVREHALAVIESPRRRWQLEALHDLALALAAAVVDERG